jgi:hypothetical protein
MIQFNLLPDVKIAYIKAQRQKHLIVSVSMIASIAAIALLVVLFLFVNVAQKKNINDLTKDIKSNAKDLAETKDLNKILTVQNQLGALDTLHGSEVVSSRVFDSLQQVTPAQVSISQFKLLFEDNTMEITGNADSLAAINTYADSLKFTKYTTTENTTKRPAFSSVVLANFSRSDGKNTYTISLSFDSEIFDRSQEISLEVPQMVTTRSSTESPSALFDQSSGGQ